MAETISSEKELFERVVKLIQSTPVTSDVKISDTTRLRLYGLYKRATIGRLLNPEDGDERPSRPSRWNLVAYYKYDAWAQCDNLTVSDARMGYVRFAASQDNPCGMECLRLLQNYYTSNHQDEQEEDASSNNHVASEEGSAYTTQSKPMFDTDVTATTRCSVSLQSRNMSMMERVLGIQPIVPRGQLDISYSDLSYALLRSMNPFYSLMPTLIHLQKEISNSWGVDPSKESLVCGQSVRSLFDLFLTYMSFPPGSEIILVPPINIEGMVQIMQYHEIRIVPVDIPLDEKGNPCVKVDIDSVKNAITANTVAIMIVHPFGLVCTGQNEMKTLKQICQKNDFVLMEDCAECYSCDTSQSVTYRGSEFSDVRFFSFGTIKTATALGGGIALFRPRSNSQNPSQHKYIQKLEIPSVAESMIRIQHTLYDHQTNSEYIIQVMKCFLFRFICTHPTFFGFLVFWIKFMGFEYDQVVTNSIKGFKSSPPKNPPTTQNQTYNLKNKATHLIQQIRKCPSPALLYLLNRRLLDTRQTSKRFRNRIKQCQRLQQLLSIHVPNIHMPSGDQTTTSKHLYWLFPILVPDPDGTSKELLKHGYDIPRGTSQIGCVTSFIPPNSGEYLSSSNTLSPCTNAEAMMRQTLYLPVPMQKMNENEIFRLVDTLREVTSPKGVMKSTTNETKKDRTAYIYNLVILFGAVTFFTIAVFPIASPYSSMAFICYISTVILQKVITLYFSIILLIGTFVYALRLFGGSFYINSSHTFAKYCSMLHNRKLDNQSDKDSLANTENVPSLKKSGAVMIHGQQNKTNGEKVLDLDLLNISSKPIANDNDSLEKNMVLVTGVTGFIGSLLLRDLLLHRQTLRIHGGVVVLCRPKRNMTGNERIEKLLTDPMFSFLKDDEKKSLVTVFEGDVTLPDVGMSKNDLGTVCNSLNITHVFHCAASVSFSQTFEDAAKSNITSALQMQAFTKRLKSPFAKYIFVSTAFVHGSKAGTPKVPLPQKPFDLDPYDAEEIYKSMLTTQSYASSAMQYYNFPNTYTFSKCVAETLLLRDNSLSTTIIRPSIVGPSIHEPYEGWAGAKPSTLIAAVCLYLKFQFNIWCFKRELVPVIPVDVVSRFIITKSFASNIFREQTHLNHDNESNKISEESYSLAKLSSDGEDYDDEKECSSSSLGEFDVINQGQCQQQIYTAAWDSSSPQETQFLWYDYAFTAIHFGSVKGYINRVMAYLGVLVTMKFFPTINLKLSTFRSLHHYLVQMPLYILVTLSQSLGIETSISLAYSRIHSFIDLPVLFFPFTNTTFHFQSDLVAPSTMDGERYMFSCVLAAGNFIEIYNEKMSRRIHTKGDNDIKSAENNSHTWSSSVILLGGRLHKETTTDTIWALTQPRGNIVIRLAGWWLRKIFRLIATELTVDIESLAHVTNALELLKKDIDTQRFQKTSIILAPTHRSLLDFLILSYITFALPELQIDIPKIAAADDFSRIPVFGWLAYFAGAFFIVRGKSKVDPSLKQNILALKMNQRKEITTCIEVFIEGKRSRDRRFNKPKTGFMRCLGEVGDDNIILPISINYEKIPDQTTLCDEAKGKRRYPFHLSSLFKWLKNVSCGKVIIGRIHVSASKPIMMKQCTKVNYGFLTETIQQLQQKQIFVSEFHISAGAKALQLEDEHVRSSLKILGCNFWPTSGITHPRVLSVPENISELWTITLQFGHLLAPLMKRSHQKWSLWLYPGMAIDTVSSDINENPNICALISSLARNFDAADKVAKDALMLLHSKGFSRPTLIHVMQYAEYNCVSIPTILVRAAISMLLESNRDLIVNNSGMKVPSDVYIENNVSSEGKMISPPVQAIFDQHIPITQLIKNYNNKTCFHFDEISKESFGCWGYKDSGFVANISPNGTRCVTMKGNRYSISGRTMPMLVDFLEKETNFIVEVDKATLPIPLEDPELSESKFSEKDLCKLNDIVGNDEIRISTSPRERARHGTGQSQEDVYAIRRGLLRYLRMPDCVIWPKTEEEIEKLMILAKQEKWCVIPFGGGTNVTHAVRCPPIHVEPRPIISVDMRLMSKVLWVNEEDRVAHVQAGIIGGALVNEMKVRGFTIGHEPDSIEFSTLGGWIATKASGMKQNKYGNIEDIVKEVRVMSPNGILWQQNKKNEAAYGRVSTGTDLCSLMFGSEGNFGIITSAVIRIFPLPETMDFESVIFPSFENGFGFVRDVAKMGSLKPASVRLLDNDQFRLGQALRNEDSYIDRTLRFVFKLISQMRGKFDHKSIVCTTLIFEGSKDEVALQKKIIQSLSSKHGGFLAGSKVGKSGYELTYAIAYLRDFALSHYFLAESFETFVPWSRTIDMIESTKKRILQEYAERALPGEPLLSCRITQLYDEGVCVYFYFCMNIEYLSNPSEIFSKIESVAREEILLQGGSLSHHHGVGKLRAEFTTSINSRDLIEIMKNMKLSFDPENILAVRNGSIGIKTKFNDA